MKIVEITGKLNKNFKRYNSFVRINPNYTESLLLPVLYGFNKGFDIVQTSSPTNILIDGFNNPINNENGVYFGIRVHPFIFAYQNVFISNGSVEYNYLEKTFKRAYCLTFDKHEGRVGIIKEYIGTLYPEPIITTDVTKCDDNDYQAFQQFINDCNFPLKPIDEIPLQSISASQGSDGIPYFNPNIYIAESGTQPNGILCKLKSTDINADNYTVQFDVNNFIFKFGLAVNNDFEKAPNIYLPNLYQLTICCSNDDFFSGKEGTLSYGLLMQAMLYDSNGKVISA